MFVRHLVHLLLLVGGALAGGVLVTMAQSTGSESAASQSEAAPPAPHGRVPSSAEPEPSTVFVPSAGGPGLSADDVRALLREELARAASADDASEEPAPTPPDPTRAREAYDHLSERLDRAIAEGMWTEADRQAAMRDLADLGPAERVEVLDRMVLAINHGELAITSEGAPWW